MTLHWFPSRKLPWTFLPGMHNQLSPFMLKDLFSLFNQSSMYCSKAGFVSSSTKKAEKRKDGSIS